MMRDEVLREKIETLDGSRGKLAARRAAVRIEDLASLLEVTQRLKSAKAASSTPTKAEFDALVDDVAMLHRRLLVVAAALQNRIL